MLSRQVTWEKVLIRTMLVVATLIGLQSTALARDLTLAEKKIVADVLRDRLRDPASAMFKWGPLQGAVKSYDDSSETSIVYCAYVNSRNAYGGFVGDTPFRVFLVLINDVVAIAAVVGIGGSQIQTDTTYDLCAEDGYDLRYFAGVNR